MEKMLWFKSDYQQGAHPEIIKRLSETSYEALSGYGTDVYSESAKAKIRRAVGAEDAEVVFVTGGTQTNQLVISSMLKPYEGVVSVVTGHINAHEAGAVEYTGHKVLTLPHHDGKMCAEELDELAASFYGDDSHEHMVYPGMVYISHPTELGTLYSKAELEAISEVCKKYNMPLFLDGARLGYGLMSYKTDVDLHTVAELCDVFYIGGTKVGALCGEAVVFTRNNMPKNFVPQIKQHGALLAKGFLNGIQFDTLFTDDLYFKIGRHVIDMAMKLKDGIVSKGYRLYADSMTNQQFAVLDNKKRDELSKKVVFENWEKPDSDHTVVRFVTGWATTEAEIEELLSLL